MWKKRRPKKKKNQLVIVDITVIYIYIVIRLFSEAWPQTALLIKVNYNYSMHNWLRFLWTLSWCDLRPNYRGTNGPFSYNRMMSYEWKIHNLKKKIDLDLVNDAYSSWKCKEKGTSIKTSDLMTPTELKWF